MSHNHSEIIYLLFLFVSRNFKLYLTTNTDLFTDNFKAVFVDKHGKEKNFDVQLQNYFTGHVVGEWTIVGFKYACSKVIFFFFLFVIFQQFPATFIFL